MNKQLYSRGSLIGRIYTWTKGYFPNKEVNSCSVRRAVLFEFPLKVVFGGWRTPLYMLTLQLYAMIFWSKYIAFDYNLLFVEFVASVAWLAFLIELLVTWEEILEPAYSRHFKERFKFSVPTPQPILKTKAILRDWWDDLYHKVCKPVEWVD